MWLREDLNLRTRIRTLPNGSLAGSRSLPHSVVQRVHIVVACAAGESNTAVAKHFGVRGSTVGKWRQHYLDLGIEKLHEM